MSVEVVLRLNGAPVPVVLDEAALAAIAAALGRGAAPSPWLTIAAAAEYINLTEHATRKLVDRGQIAKHQHVRGGRILLRRDDLDAYLREGRTR